jgi:hypothetical protein
VALSVYRSSGWILECSAVKLAVVFLSFFFFFFFFWSDHREPLPQTWRMMQPLFIYFPLPLAHAAFDMMGNWK